MDLKKSSRAASFYNTDPLRKNNFTVNNSICSLQTNELCWVCVYMMIDPQWNLDYVRVYFLISKHVKVSSQWQRYLVIYIFICHTTFNKWAWEHNDPLLQVQTTGLGSHLLWTTGLCMYLHVTSNYCNKIKKVTCRWGKGGREMNKLRKSGTQIDMGN